MHNHPDGLGGFDSRHGVYGLLPDAKHKGGLLYEVEIGRN